MRGVIIPADDSRPIITVELRDEPNSLLFDIIGMVGGFERVRIGDVRTRQMFGTEDYWVTMVVDDNGNLIGKPTNLRASILYGAPIHGNVINGDALLLGEHYGPEGPEFTNLPLPFQSADQWTAWFTEVEEALS